MDANNTNTWRSDLPNESRQKIVKRIMDTLQRHMPPTDQESMGELLKIAWRFEEKIFHAAADQQDYLRKISLKMLSLETKAQASPATAIQARLGNPAGAVRSLDVGAPNDPGEVWDPPQQANTVRPGAESTYRQSLSRLIGM